MTIPGERLSLPNVEGLPPKLAALTYARAGWHVFPCEASNHDPIKKSWSKKPHSMLRAEEAARGEGGWKLATTDPIKVEHWWDKDPNALIGLVPGMSGAVILDADGAAGIKAMYDKAENLDLAYTVTSRTPGKGGGLHVWFDRRHVSGVVGNGSLKGVPGEARGDRGYVIVPPSRLPDGGEYKFTGHTYDLAELPGWASALLPWEGQGTTAARASIADVTRGDEQEWLDKHSAPWNDEAAKQAVADAVSQIRGAKPGDQELGRHVTATRMAASLLSKAQRREFAIDLAGALGDLREALIKIKPGGGPDFDRFVADAIALRVAEDKARAASSVDVSVLRVAEEEQITWADPDELGKREEGGTGVAFPTDELPDVMKRYVEEVAKATQVSVVLPVLAALGAASAATAGGIVVSLNPTWTEGLSLYLIGVADPSERKTAALKPFVDSIRNAANEWVNSTAGDRATWVAEGAALDSRMKEAKKLAATPEGQQEVAKLELLTQDWEAEGQRWVEPKGIIHADPTQEALVVEMAKYHGVGFIASSEGAFIANLAGRYRSSGDRSDFTVVNEAYSRSFIRSTRVTRGDAVVPVPHLTIVSFVQPRVAELLAQPDFEATGFLSRVLYAHPPSMVGGRETKVSRLQPLYHVAQDAWRDRMVSLFARGWGREAEPHVMTLEMGAVESLEAWWEGTERAAVTDAWWGKAHGNVVRIAAVLELVEDPRATRVSASSMAAAITLMEWFGLERERMRRLVIDGEGFGIELSEAMRRMLGHIARRWDRIGPEGVRLRDLAKWMHKKHAETFDVAEQLVELGWLAEGERETYVPHPAIPVAAETGFEGRLGASWRLPEQANVGSGDSSQDMETAPLLPRSAPPTAPPTRGTEKGVLTRAFDPANPLLPRLPRGGPMSADAGVDTSGPELPRCVLCAFSSSSSSSSIQEGSRDIPCTHQDAGGVETQTHSHGGGGATGAVTPKTASDQGKELPRSRGADAGQRGALAGQLDEAVEKVLAEPDVAKHLRSFLPTREEGGTGGGHTNDRDRCPECNSLWMKHGVTGEPYCPKGCDR